PIGLGQGPSGFYGHGGGLEHAWFRGRHRRRPVRSRRARPRRRLSARRYDLAIVGAGPAGSALAIRAARGGASVLLVDRDDFRRPRFGETAPPLLRRAMAELDLGHLLEAPHIGVEAPAVISVWG